MLFFEIEATNQCNTICLHCPREKITRPLGMMDWDTYQIVTERIIEYMGADPFGIYFTGMGEPLINPQIYDFIRHLSGRAQKSLTTNASALTGANTSKLIEAGLDRLWVSFNGGNSDLYELVMGGLSFERAGRNIREALRLAQGTQLKIGANISIIRQTQDRLEEIRDFLHDLGIQDILYAQGHNRGGFLDKPDVTYTPLPPVDLHRCDVIFKLIFIAWTGQVLSCCQDLAGENVLGDLRVESIEKIQQRKLAQIQNGVNFRICASCNDIYRFEDDYTPDGAPLSEWIFGLYDHQPNDASKTISSLSRWLFDLYAREGRLALLFERMAVNRAILLGELAGKDEKIGQICQEATEHISPAESQAAQSVALVEEQPDLHSNDVQGEIQALKRQIEAIQNSRSWILLSKTQKLRKAFFPDGSRREMLLNHLIK